MMTYTYFDKSEWKHGGGGGVIVVWHKMLTIREHPVLSSGFGDSNRPRILGIHVSFGILELPM